MPRYNKVALIACSGEKAPHAAQVRNLYTSRRFRKEVAHAETQGYRPFVLSGRHGLLDLDEVREPYDETLEGKSIEEIAAWADRVSNRLVRFLPIDGKVSVRVYAAGLYANPLAESLSSLSEAPGITIEYLFNQVAAA